MARIKVYGCSVYNSQRVTLALFEKQVDFEVVYVNLRNGEHKKPAFMSMQPFHQTPVFVCGDFKIFESRAIVRYIAQKLESQGTPLLGETLEEQAVVNQWVEVEAHNLNPPFKVLSMEYFLEEVFDVFEARLSKSKYLAGYSYSMADLTCAPSLLNLMSIKPELIASRKHVKVWYEELSSRQRLGRCWKKMQNGFLKIMDHFSLKAHKKLYAASVLIMFKKTLLIPFLSVPLWSFETLEKALTLLSNYLTAFVL